MAKKTWQERHPGWMIPPWEKILYYVGGSSYMSVHTFISMFLAAYLLMVGISPAISATVLLIMKAWDAINDILFGYYVDRIRFKPHKNRLVNKLFSGRFMPWMRMAVFILPFSSIIIFNASAGAPLWLRLTQFVVGYLIYDTATTLVIAPGGGLLLSATSNLDERNHIQAFGVFGGVFTSLPVVFLGTAFIAGSFGYGGSATFFAIYGFVLALPFVFIMKERNVSADAVVSQELYTLKEMWRFLKGAKEFLFFELGQLAWGLFYTSGYILFLAFYVFGEANLALIYAAIGVIPTIFLAPFYPMIFKKIDKIVCVRIACLLYVICGLCIWSLGPEGAKTNMGLHYLLYALITLAYVFTMMGSSMMMPDIAELARFRSRTERVGIIYSINAFVTKLVASLVTSVSLLILGAYGYVSVKANSFEELAALNAKGIGLQSEHALQGLWNVSFLFPIFGFAAAGILFLFVKLSNKNVRIMMKANSGEITHEEAELAMAAPK